MSNEPATPTEQPPSGPPRLTVVDRVRIARDIFTIVAFSVAGVWAATTFWYHSSYVPAHERPIVTTKLTFSIVGEKDGKVAINAHLALKNDGKATQNIWGLTFHAFSQKVAFAPLNDGGWSQREETATGLEGYRDFREEPALLIASSVDVMTKPGRRNAILPQAEIHFDFFFYADRATADAVVVAFDVLQPTTDIPAKPEWFTLQHDGDKPVAIVATDACKAAPACDTRRTNASKQLSLWKRSEGGAGP
jgi:hypothetical protein